MAFGDLGRELHGFLKVCLGGKEIAVRCCIITGLKSGIGLLKLLFAVAGRLRERTLKWQEKQEDQPAFPKLATCLHANVSWRPAPVSYRACGAPVVFAERLSGRTPGWPRTATTGSRVHVRLARADRAASACRCVRQRCGTWPEFAFRMA